MKIQYGLNITDILNVYVYTSSPTKYHVTVRTKTI